MVDRKQKITNKYESNTGNCINYIPCSINTIIAVIFLVSITGFLIFLFFKIDKTRFGDIYKYVMKLEGEKCTTKITFKDFESIFLIIFILLDYIVLSVVLLIIIIKDDRGIRFAKLNELARIEESFKNSNCSKELYKKYMDTIAEI